MKLFNLLPGFGLLKDSIWEAFALFDIGQMLTPPKSKDPWTAMTKGSTGGWAGWANNPAVRYGAQLGAGMVPGIGPALSAGIGAAQSYPGYKKPIGEQLLKTGIGTATGYGMGKLGQGVGNLIGNTAKGTPGGFQSAYDWFKGAPSTAAGATQFAAPPSTMGSMSYGQQGYVPELAGALPKGGGFGPSGTYAPTGAPYSGQGLRPEASYLQKGATGTPSWLSDVTGAAQAPAQQTSQSAIEKWFGSKAGKTLGGSAISAIGGMGGRGEMPTSPYTQTYTDRLLGGSPLGQRTQEEMINIMDRPEPSFEPLSDEMYTTAVRLNKEEETRAEEALRTEWKGVRPGADIESDAGFRKDVMKMRERFRNERMAIRNEVAYKREQDYMQQLDTYYSTKMNYLTTTMGLDQQTLQHYAQLAQMDTDRLQDEYALSAGEAANFKQLFGDLGEMFMQEGLDMFRTGGQK